MDWTYAIGAGLALCGVLAFFGLRRRGIRPGERAELRFRLDFESEWGAELFARTLVGGPYECELGHEGRAWFCTATRSAPYELAGLAKLGGELERIAAARGGSCTRCEARAGKHVAVHSFPLER